MNKSVTVKLKWFVWLLSSCLRFKIPFKKLFPFSLFSFQRNNLTLIIFLLFITPIFSQKHKIADLPTHLNEISGLVFLNDTVLVAHNDGGDEPLLYFLNLKGEQFHQVRIENATNVDWEDITTDGKGTLYIADIGNNLNNRRDLCVYKVFDSLLLQKEKVTAEIIRFSYHDQMAFPPDSKNLHYDAEAIAYLNDSLYIYTKCRTIPWDGISLCYSLPTKGGEYVATKKTALVIGMTGWQLDSVTAADIKNGKCYLLTYNRVITYSIEPDQLLFVDKTILLPIKQFEAITVNSEGHVFVANEKRKHLGGPSLYLLK